MREIAANVFVETNYERVTIAAVLTGDGWVCIDAPSYPADARAWLAALQTISDRPVRYLICTDHHHDRIVTSGLFGAPLVMHAAAASRLLTLERSDLAEAAQSLSKDERVIAQIMNARIGRPHISYSDALTLFTGEWEFELVSQPSATAGSTWVRLPAERIVFVGDSVCLDRHPFIGDGPASAWLEALERLQDGAYAGWTVVGGRNGVVQPGALAPLRDYLRAAQAQVEGLHAAGGQRADVGALVPEFVERFPCPVGQEAQVEQHVRAGLEALFDGLVGPGGERPG